MTPSLDLVRPCLEGVIPGMVATCDAGGIPNVSYVSQIHFVDSEHVALSFQFFNKTRHNMQQNPQLTAYLIDPETVARYRLAMLYLRTETDGPLFQNMKAKLASIASHTGMSDVFALKGADICRVLHIEKVSGAEAPRVDCRYNWPTLLRSLSELIASQYDLSSVFESVLGSLHRLLGIEHAMILIAEECDQKLYTVASYGYPCSGVGSELPFGCGVVGVAAQYRTPIRINHMSSDYLYSEVIRDNLDDQQLETGIPFPGLDAPQSQLAIPLLAEQRLVGVLFVESTRELAFDFQHEDALMVLGYQIANTVCNLQRSEAHTEPAAPAAATPLADLPAITVRYFPENHSVFIDDEYLIKGVAGSILWRLLSIAQREQRIDFSNRELRLDPHLRLPDIDDNLEARLILLRRRLEEKCPVIQLQKTGRGRFRLIRHRPVTLVS